MSNEAPRAYSWKNPKHLLGYGEATFTVVRKDAGSSPQVSTPRKQGGLGIHNFEDITGITS